MHSHFGNFLVWRVGRFSVMLSYFITKFLSALTPPFCPIFIGFIFIGVKFGFGTFFFLLLSVRLGAQCFELLFPFSVMIFLVGEVWMRDAVDFVSYFSAAINTRETEMEQIIHTIFVAKVFDWRFCLYFGWQKLQENCMPFVVTCDRISLTLLFGMMHCACIGKCQSKWKSKPQHHL